MADHAPHQEKEHSEHVEFKEAPTKDSTPVNEVAVATRSSEGDDIDKSKLLRKMDWRLIPMLTVLYLLSFLDRGSIGNAKILGMVEDLGLAGKEYNLCLTVFFFTYCAFEVPSNLLLKKLRPSVWLPSIMVAWGVCTMCQGFVKGYHGLLIVRIFLGLAESGLYPGVAFYLTTWYSQEDLAFRQGLFFSAASLAGAFSGLLAYAINNMDGIAGYAGWRWIFIIEGLLTVAVAFVAYFLIFDEPSTAPFLTPAEKKWIKAQLDRHSSPNVDNQDEESQGIQWAYVRMAFKDWQLWLGLLVYWGIACPLYGMSFFLPTIVHELGYSATNAQLLMIPIYAAASICTVVICYFSDRQRTRSSFLLPLMLTIITGFILTISGSARGGLPALVYTGALISTCATYPAYVCLVAWTAGNLAPTYKRAAGMAFTIGMGNLGGAMASNFYREQDSPKFLLGHGLEMGFAALGLVGAAALRLLYAKINASRDRAAHESVSVEERNITDYSDRAVTFRYTF